jgi:hypothetical protein
MDPKSIPLTFFRKASGSISGPFDEIIKPQRVKLLDYGVEIWLVIGRDIPVGTELTESNLADFIAGLVVTNGVSARDVQLTKTRFYEASRIRRSPRSARSCALHPDPVASLLRAAVQCQANNPKYLQHGDIVELSVVTDDGAIDLGTQRTAVRYA